MSTDDVKDRLRNPRKPSIIRGARLGYLAEVTSGLQFNRKTLHEIDADTGFTALQFAIARGNLSIVKLLLEQKDTKTEVTDAHGRTPLELAVEIGHPAILSELLKAKAREK